MRKTIYSTLESGFSVSTNCFLCPAPTPTQTPRFTTLHKESIDALLMNNLSKFPLEFFLALTQSSSRYWGVCKSLLLPLFFCRLYKWGTQGEKKTINKASGNCVSKTHTVTLTKSSLSCLRNNPFLGAIREQVVGFNWEGFAGWGRGGPSRAWPCSPPIYS